MSLTSWATVPSVPFASPSTGISGNSLLRETWSLLVDPRAEGNQREGPNRVCKKHPTAARGFTMKALRGIGF